MIKQDTYIQILLTLENKWWFRIHTAFNKTSDVLSLLLPDVLLYILVWYLWVRQP